MGLPKSIAHLVVIVSSVEGVEALSTIMATLPPTFPAPIVVAQHQDLTPVSQLSALLAQRSKLPVRAVHEPAPLEPGVVYIVSSSQPVHISEQMIDPHKASTDQPNPPAHLLFSSAASAFGESLIAVILSDLDADGASAARAVKQAGGAVIIQDVAAPTVPSMPLAPSTVDIVAQPERMGAILTDLVAGNVATTRLDDRAALDSILEETRARRGIDLSSHEPPAILRRIQRRIIATNSHDLPGYVQRCQRHPEEYQRLARSFVGAAEKFFRDPELFASLRQTVVPEMIARARKHRNELRIWVAGCTTGEEAYSLAILIAQELGSSLQSFNVRIIATDADADAVAYARRGIYTAPDLVGLSVDVIETYFSHDNGVYRINKRIRAMTIFGQHDLVRRAPFPRIDLILCRNMLSYFTPALKQRALRLFAFALREGGYLALGSGETTNPRSHGFDLQHQSLKIYRRQGRRTHTPPARFSDTRPLTQWQTARGAPPADDLAARRSSETPLRAPLPGASVPHALQVGVLVVDRRYDIYAINKAARQLLAIQGPAMGEDLIHLVPHTSNAALRSAIDAAFTTGMPDVIPELMVEQHIADTARALHVVCHPQRTDGEHGAVESVMLVIHDVTDGAQAHRQMEQRPLSTEDAVKQSRAETAAESARKDQLIERLMDTNRQLIEAYQSLASTNAEAMQSSEETQAAAEEVETLNEELQATNEELETLTEELRATVEELNTTNDDLRERSVELQKLAQTTEDERARLAGVLLSIGDAVLVVNKDATPVLTNAAYERMMASGVFVPRDENGHPLPDAETPRQRIAQGNAFSMEFTVTTPEGTRRWFEASGQPIESGGVRQGGVVLMRDITERSLHRLQDEFLAMASHELHTPLTPLQGYLQRLAKSLENRPENDPQRRYVESAMRQVRRLARLAGDLLDVTRLQSGIYRFEMQRMQVDQVLTRVIETMRVTAPTHSFRVESAGVPLLVNGDTDRLEQVFYNLLNNALTYAINNRQIDISVRQLEREAEIQVRDYGSGIPAAILPRVFSRFYQANDWDRDLQYRRGLGLGLYITKQIVEAHGGHIEAESTEGSGTTFTVRLPLA